jgi:hypothetical protein
VTCSGWLVICSFLKKYKELNYLKLPGSSFDFIKPKHVPPVRTDKLKSYSFLACPNCTEPKRQTSDNCHLLQGKTSFLHSVYYFQGLGVEYPYKRRLFCYRLSDFLKYCRQYPQEHHKIPCTHLILDVPTIFDTLLGSIQSTPKIRLIFGAIGMLNSFLVLVSAVLAATI